MKRVNGDSDIILINPNDEKSVIKNYKQVIPVSIYHFYITDEIGEPDKYLDLINVLKTAEEHDTIFIYLNTPGGNLNTTIQIMASMKQSVGTIVTVLEGEVCSAGTLIFLSGQKFIVNDHCTFMIHNYSHGVIGKGNEVASRVKYSEKYFKDLANSIYGKFLTQDEMTDMLDGKDFWFSSAEVLERLMLISDDVLKCEAEQITETVEEVAEVKQVKPNTVRPTKK